MANPLKLLKLKPTGFQFIQEIPIDAPPKRVWSSLLNVSKWFGFETDHKERTKGTIEVFPGGRWFFESKDGTTSLFGTVTHIEPGKLLRVSGSLGLTHLPATSVCIFELQPRKNGKSTLLRLGQRTFGFIDADVKKRYMGGWKQLIGQLKAVAEKH